MSELKNAQIKQKFNEVLNNYYKKNHVFTTSWLIFDIIKKY